jgi:hypothetical protein
LLFFRSDEVAGMAFKVDRIYFGETLACGEGVTEDFPPLSAQSLQRYHDMLTFAGRMIGGGG